MRTVRCGTYLRTGSANAHRPPPDDRRRERRRHVVPWIHARSLYAWNLVSSQSDDDVGFDAASNDPYLGTQPDNSRDANRWERVHPQNGPVGGVGE